jgi:hypothetical protein
MRRHAGGEVQGSFEEVAFDDFVDDAQFLRPAGAHEVAGGDEVERGPRADEPRQALRAAGAGQDSELHLGKPDLGRGQRDTVMAAQRDFEPAAERGAVDRGDDRLCRALDAGDDEVEIGRLERLTEFLDIRAGDEGAPGADDDERTRRAVAEALCQRIEKALAHRPAQRVHRRIVDGDHADRAALLVADHLRHISSPWLFLLAPLSTIAER